MAAGSGGRKDAGKAADAAGAPGAAEAATALDGRDFIRAIVASDLREGTHGGRVVTRFPPEPNGFLHIGHAKSIGLNFGIAAEVPGARCHLRFDDTNPETEDEAYVEAIRRDVEWLGWDWGEHLYFASDYFPRMYEFAEHLIRTGHAYVDSASEEEIREARGTVTEPGRPTKYRERGVEENLDLFRRMRAGEFADGAHVLFSSSRDGEWQIWRMPAEGGEAERLTESGAYFSQLDSKGTLYFSRNDQSGLWRLERDGSVTRIVDDLPPLDCTNWTLVNDNVWYVSRDESGAPLLMRRDLAGESVRRMPLDAESRSCPSCS